MRRVQLRSQAIACCPARAARIAATSEPVARTSHSRAPYRHAGRPAAAIAPRLRRRLHMMYPARRKVTPRERAWRRRSRAIFGGYARHDGCTKTGSFNKGVAMTNQEQFASIDAEELAFVAGGWNPFKSAWNEAKKVGHAVVDATSAGIDYVKNHPEILLQTSRRF
jgi:hypothetical protein